MNIQVDLNAQVQGRFKFEVRNKDTHEITKEIDWFDNLVLDSGLNYMATESWIYGVAVGTGSGEPIASQTDLAARFAISSNYQTNTSGASSVEPYYKWRRIRYRFNAGVFNNTILTEVGIFTSKYIAQVPQIWNRALIKDALGNPTSITLLPDEYLDVTIEIRLYVNSNDTTGSFDLVGKSGAKIRTVNYTTRPLSLTKYLSFGNAVKEWNNTYAYIYNGSLAPNTSDDPLGTELLTCYENSSTNSIRHAAYVADSKYVEFTATVGLNSLNGVNMGALMIQTTLGNYQIEFDTPFQKTASQILKFLFRVHWDRYQ